MKIITLVINTCSIILYPFYKIIEKVVCCCKRYDLRLKCKRFHSLGSNPVFDPNHVFINGFRNIIIGDNFGCGRFVRIEAIEHRGDQSFSPSLVIGNNVTMEDYCHIGCINSVVIGNNVMMGSKVLITDHLHGEASVNDIGAIPQNRPLTFKSIKIGNDVWIGDGVCIMPGVTLGDNVIVGANSVVTHNFPDRTVIAGCPARIIKEI